MKIFVSIYEAADKIALTHQQAAAAYAAALQARYPAAELHIVGDLLRLRVTDDDGAPIHDQRISEMREIIGRTWEQLAIAHPLEP